ncbi:MAG: DEAD/DEAH box helicase [Solirubrobacteraceae bacterium]
MACADPGSPCKAPVDSQQPSAGGVRLTAAPPRPAARVTLERCGPRPLLVLDVAFEFNALVKRIPGRRFDWRRRVWTVPLQPLSLPAIDQLIAGSGALVDDCAADWLEQQRRSSRATATVADRAGEPVLLVDASLGELARELGNAAGARRDEQTPRRLTLPLDAACAALLERLESVEIDDPASIAIAALRDGRRSAGATLALTRDDAGERRFELAVDWALEAASEFSKLGESRPTGERSGRFLFRSQRQLTSVPADAALSGELRRWLKRRAEVELTTDAAAHLSDLESAWARAEETVALSRAHDAELLDLPAPLDAQMRPFQRAGVAYVLRQRRSFLADEQGLGKTVQALAAVELDRALPAVVVCPASVKLVWEREIARWLPHRRAASVQGRSERSWAASGAHRAEIIVVNYEIVEGQLARLLARSPRAAIFDESHYCKDGRRKRTKAAQALASEIPTGGLRLALTGTPILNRAPELVSQLRLLDRLSDFGSGAALARRFQDPQSVERLHQNLRAHCYVRRTKSEVLPQLPAKRTIYVPLDVTNRREYAMAEADLVAWLRTQPLELTALKARIAAALRAEQLVRINELRRLVARGKLAAALAWIEDFTASGEPLVVFAHHREVQGALLRRFPAAAHLLGSDSTRARAASVDSFQRPDGPELIVCSMQAASQGITLTRASNVAFLELDWTPARHDQAEDRCHRIGQPGAVSAYYLLARETIDETMSEVIERKRGVIGAVTDGRELPDEAMLQRVVRSLHEGPQRGWLRAVA